MFNQDKQKNGEVLTFRKFFFGLLPILPRVPSIFKTLKEMTTFEDDARMSLGGAMEQNAQKYPDKTAILFEDRQYTHQEFNAAINQYAHSSRPS